MPFFAHNESMLEIYNQLLRGSYIANDPPQFILQTPRFSLHLMDRDRILDSTRITEYHLHISGVRRLDLKGFAGKTLPSFLIFKTLRYDRAARLLVLGLEPSVEMEFHVESVSAELDQI